MNLLQKTLFIASLIEIFCFVNTQSAVWRSVTNAILSCSGTLDSSITTLNSCNQTCLNQGSSCLSYSFSSTKGCLIYDTRFGFSNCQLKIDNDYEYYYEKPIDIDDDYGNILNQSQATNGVETFLSRYRTGIPGYVDPGSDTLVIKSGISSAEECAKYCTRRRGVIDDVVGTRCDSFNYQSNTKTCHLMSVSLDATHDIDLGQGSWKYYDRLKGDGCWLTQTACRHIDDTDYVGNFQVSNINYEYECIEEAKNYHENICDNLVTVPTVAVWGGDGSAVFDAWNSWDYTTGCVIDFKNATCRGPSKNATRFSGKFRDSIGEEQFAAWFKADYCFDRASVWISYCNFQDSNQQINVSYPDTNSYYIYPVTNCECNSYGKKIDIATDRPFCTRNDTSDICWRPNQQDYWSYPDILCDDTTCPDYNSSSHNASQTHCWLLDFFCRNNYISESYYQIPCSNNTNICNYNEEQCLANAETYHNLCGNSDSDSEEQAIVFYMPTGAMNVYPPFEKPAEISLIEGIYGDAAYTTYNSSDISLISLSSGRWMSFTALKTATVRQITIFWYSTQTATLTLALYEGSGTTGTPLLTTTTTTFSPSTNTVGDYIHFEIDSIDVTSGNTYTWQVSSTDGSNDVGYIGYIPGNLYGNGGGDLTWDYIFVEWIEYYKPSSQALLAAVTTHGPGRPWFEVWFIIGLVLFFLFALFLLFLHYQRKRNEKKAEEEERKLQAEIKKRARLQAQGKAQNNPQVDNEDENAKYVALSGDSPKGANNKNKTDTNVADNNSAIIEEEPNTN